MVRRRNEGFDFLGYHFEGGQRWPRDEEPGEAQGRRSGRRPRGQLGQALRQIIADVNRTLRGWFRLLQAQPSLDVRARSTDGSVAGCGASCGGDSGARGIASSRGADQIALAQRLLCRAWVVQLAGRPCMRSANPLAGKTTDWRAGCGRSASPVRREGEAAPLPTPMVVALTLPLRMAGTRPGHDDESEPGGVSSPPAVADPLCMKPSRHRSVCLRHRQ